MQKGRGQITAEYGRIMRRSMCLGYKGRMEAYIYIWYSRSVKLVYIGQTNNIHGVIGRACQHVSHSKGTLYERVYDEGYYLDDIDDFVLLSYPLPREKKYTSEESSYRISVEYLVQKKIIEKKIKSPNKYKTISNVDPGSYISLATVNNIADEIVKDFIDAYNND